MFVILTNKQTSVEITRYWKFIAVARTLSSLKVKTDKQEGTGWELSGVLGGWTPSYIINPPVNASWSAPGGRA